MTTPRFARLPVFLIAGATLVVLVATSARYGYLGDELYFVAAGHHLSWGYADQPPMLPLLARLMDTLAPGSLMALRVPAELVTAAGVVVAALIARELGGERRAQWQTAAAFAVCIQLLGGGHFLATSTIDPFLWTVITWLVVRWVRTRQDRLLLFAGLVTAVDLQVKYLIPIFWVVLGVSALVVGPRELWRRPLLWAGMAIAVVTTVPSLLWQAHHGWPQLAVNAAITQEVATGYDGRIGFVPFAIIAAGILAGAVMFCYGLWRLLRSPELKAYRFLGWTVVGIAFLVLLSEGRYYYVAGMYPLCWAVAAVEMQRRRPAVWWRWTTSWPSFAVSAIISVLIVLPVLPLSMETSRTETVGGSIGWPQFTSEVAAAYHALPADQRNHVAVIGESYWQASAIDRYGPADGLPSAYSPSRGFWYFGQPPDSATTALFVGANGTALNRYFTSVHRTATITIAGGVQGQQTGVAVWECTGMRMPWPEIWGQNRNP